MKTKPELRCRVDDTQRCLGDCSHLCARMTEKQREKGEEAAAERRAAIHDYLEAKGRA